jgi:hypothetical protein
MNNINQTFFLVLLQYWLQTLNTLIVNITKIVQALQECTHTHTHTRRFYGRGGMSVPKTHMSVEISLYEHSSFSLLCTPWYIMLLKTLIVSKTVRKFSVSKKSEGSLPRSQNPPTRPYT